MTRESCKRIATSSMKVCLLSIVWFVSNVGVWAFNLVDWSWKTHFVQPAFVGFVALAVCFIFASLCKLGEEE